jgi:type VI protein secretion system component Hcp
MADHFIPDMFLDFPSAQGECEVEGYNNTIAVMNYDFSVHAVSTQNQGKGQKGGAGTMSPIYIEIVHDKGYAKLRKFAGMGTVTSSQVTLTRTANSKKDEVIKLTNTKVVSANSTHHSGAQNTASVVLTFDEAMVETYMDQDGTGDPVVADSTTYKLDKGTTE